MSRREGDKIFVEKIEPWKSLSAVSERRVRSEG